MSKEVVFIKYLLILVLLLITGCTIGNPNVITVDTIKNRGYLRVGVKEDVPGFGYFNRETNQYEGLEIDIAKLIAYEIFGDYERIEFIPVTTSTRGPILDSYEIDLVIATFTITEERRQNFNFSPVYYTDYVGIMVKRDSGISTFKDLGGKSVGVVQLAPTKDVLQTVITETGIKVTLMEFASAPEVKAALDSGYVDAFSIGCSILNGYLDDTTEILAEKYSPQPLGAATKLNNKSLAKYINGLIEKWLKDGTIMNLMDKNYLSVIEYSRPINEDVDKNV